MAGGAVYLGYMVYMEAKKLKDAAARAAGDVAAAFNQNPSVSPSDQPAGPAPDVNFVSARIMEPADNGVAYRGFFDRKFKIAVAIGNPGGVKTVAVTVKVTAYSRLGAEPEVLQTSQRIELAAMQTKTYD